MSERIVEPHRSPFARGSVSIRLYPHNDLGAQRTVAEFCEQARRALDNGFDGVMASEHHGGFPGYLPNPTQMAGFVLSTTEVGWVAPCPLLLPLRPVALVAEEIAWLAARFCGRVGLGVAIGALPSDFDLVGINFEEAVSRFKVQLPRLVALLAGRDLDSLAADPALERCGESPVPVLSAAASPGAVRRAAGAGAGLLFEGRSPPERLARLSSAYRDAGGRGPIVLIRRVWLGEPQRELIDAQRAVYDSYAPGAAADQTIAASGPEELAELLGVAQRAAGADAINLRVHLPGLAPEVIRAQIDALAHEVVPRLRIAARGEAD